MKFPWVSRELYERVSKELERSEKERRELLDTILGRMAEAVVAEAVTAPGTSDADEVVDPVTGRLDADKLRRMATKAAYQRAGLVTR